MAEKYDFDLFVIGAGSGGVRASRVAASLGARVAVAEERYLGGTCVNVGCIPKKLLVYASEFSDTFTDCAEFGWTLGERSFDWGTLIANKNDEIARLNCVYEKVLTDNGVRILRARAIVVGGGYIGVEFAGIFHGLGTKVSLIHRGDLFLRGFDDDVRRTLAVEMGKRGIDLR